MRKASIMIAMCCVMTACAHTPAHKPMEKGAHGKAKSSHGQMFADYKVYDADRDSMADVDTAIAKAKARGTKAMIVMGANWCHDSRGFASRMAKPTFQTLIQDNYELVYVSAGTEPRQKDQNTDVSKRFGVDQIEGTPTVFIVNGEGEVLNADSAGFWRRAASIPTDMSYAYLNMYAKK